MTAARDPVLVAGTAPAGTNRRDLLVAALALPVLGLLEVRAAAAEAATREAFHYQDHPNAGLRCGQCLFFVAATSGPGGVCRIIDGEVSASGWCQAYRPA